MLYFITGHFFRTMLRCKKMKITLELPDMEQFTEIDGQHLKELLIANLYNTGKLSEKEAREVVGKT